MGRHRALRTIKVCAHCGGGYDAFRNMEVRGRYCSPGCLQAAREARRASAGTSLEFELGSVDAVLGLASGTAPVSAPKVA